jgi:hypothetical protein
MPSEELHYPIDQARDPIANYFGATAGAYEAYLREEYNENFGSRRDEWGEHYRGLRRAFGNSVAHLMEDKGIKRKEMNIAVIGPGIEPVGRDFNIFMVDHYLRELNKIVVIDFIPGVVRSAIKSLMRSKIPSHLMYGVQYDITDGLSTAYRQYIFEALASQKSDSEDDFSDMIAEKICTFDIEEIKKRRMLGMYEGPGLLNITTREEPLAGGWNEGRSLAFTVNKNPLPLHMISLQMVLAGTGAEAEGALWGRFFDVTASDPNPSFDLKMRRRTIYTQIHQMITLYNTTISKSIISKLLNDNPDASVLAVTDISTIHAKPRFGRMPRLDVTELERALAEQNILTTVSSIQPWVWNDEPEHSHQVEAIVFERAPVQKDKKEDSQPGNP